MAGSRVFVRQLGSAFTPVDAEQFGNEELLQQVLADHPDLLDGAQLSQGEPLRWLLVGREVGIPDASGGGDRFSVDHLLLDHEGVATLVEVKRSTDTRLRREVVGQMLDYAVNALRHWPVERLREQVVRTHGDDAEPIAALLGVHDESAVAAWWQLVAERLYEGEIRMVFVADAIPEELQAIVEFLNERLERAEVVAVEIGRFGDGQLEVLVPRVIGRTAVAKRRKRGATAGYEQQRRAASAAFHELEDRVRAWAEQQGHVLRTGEKSLRVESADGVHLGSLYPQWERFEVFLAAMWDTEHEEVARQTLEAFEEIAGSRLRPQQPGVTATALLPAWGHLTDTILPPYIAARRALRGPST